MNSKKKKNQEGSILILTLLALVGAMSIAVAISTVSIIERKMTTKSRKSVTAFQSANTGLEWAMKKINDAGPDETVDDVFDDSVDSGEVDCPSTLFHNGASCKIILLEKGDSNGERQKISSTDVLVRDIVAIRSRGTFGSGTEEVGRALEAFAMPNCGTDEVRVADFCVEKNYKDDNKSWDEAVKGCVGAGKRLCSAAELKAVDDAEVLSDTDDDTIGNNEEWSSDVSSGTQGIYLDGGADIQEGALDNSHSFRCCRNR